jgi:hypothetical protein
VWRWGLLCWAPARWCAEQAAAKKRKVIVITFGGGARDQETFAPEGQENIPHLLHELAPQSSFFTQVMNQGILGHYVATASLATGVYETLNNFSAVPPEHPTVFEYFRKDLHRPPSDAWVVAPSNGFNRIGESDYRSFGQGLGARVVLPKHLLAAAMSGSATDYAHLLRDNYETPLYTPQLAGSEFELQQLEMILKLSVDDFKAHALTVSSPDELSMYIARRLMQQESPSLLWITMHDIDVAHAGAYSLYIDASGARIGFVRSFGRRRKASPSTRATQRCSSCRILDGMPTRIPAATDFSIIAPATQPPGPPG